MQYVLCFSTLAVSAALLVIICIKGRTVPERYYPLKIVVLYLISNVVSLNPVPNPLGALVCFVYVFSRRPVNNQKFKLLIILLGFCTSVLLHYTKGPWVRAIYF